MRVVQFPAGFHPLDRTRINWITSVAFRFEPRLISSLDLEFLLHRSLITELDPSERTASDQSFGAGKVGPFGQ